MVSLEHVVHDGTKTNTQRDQGEINERCAVAQGLELASTVDELHHAQGKEL
jgi:hypothetical protein